MFIKPGVGLKVRDPDTKQLIADEGQEVNELDMYWASRLRDRDVVPATRPADPPAARKSSVRADDAPAE